MAQIYRGRSFDSPEAWGREIARRLPVLLAALIAVPILWGGFYTVKPHERAVVLRFGRYKATEGPGLHLKIPIVDSAVRVSVDEQIMRLPVDFDPDERRGGREAGRAAEEESLELTGDLNAAIVQWTVQWQVIDPAKYLFSVQNEHIAQMIEVVAKSVMHRLVGDYSMDEILTGKREEIGLAALKATQEVIDHFDCGVDITDLQMQRVTAPDRVKPAFDDVNAAIQMRDKLVNEANRERNQILPQAHAQRDRLIREAEGYADRRRAEAQGEISALLAKYRAYQEAPDITRRRLYLETMEEVLAASGPKVVLDADLGKLVPLLDLGGDGSRVLPGRSREGR